MANLSAECCLLYYFRMNMDNNTKSIILVIVLVLIVSLIAAVIRTIAGRRGGQYTYRTIVLGKKTLRSSHSLGKVLLINFCDNFFIFFVAFAMKRDKNDKS